MTNDEIWNAKKLSRTWRLTVFWSVMVPVAMVAQVVLASLKVQVNLPIGEIVGLAGAVSAAYVGKRAVQEWKDVRRVAVPSIEEASEVHPAP